MTKEDAKNILIKTVDAIRFLSNGYGKLVFLNEYNPINARYHNTPKPKGIKIASKKGEYNDFYDTEGWQKDTYCWGFNDFLKEIGINVENT
jgi:hypothetical protein